MKELDLQAMIVDLVNDRLGYARKTSHRFLVGIADLLIKIPDYPAFKLEVKQRIMQGDVYREFTLNDVTALQKRDMREAQAAGMNSAVMSFLQTRSGLRSLYGAAFMIDTLERDSYVVSTAGHVFMGDSRDRNELLWMELRKVASYEFDRKRQ